jgi:pullulanase/glycogen debranching enzyme
MVQEDYTKNKVWVCAYLSNLFNSYSVTKLYKNQEMRKTGVGNNNFFDYDKWLNKYDPQASQEPDQASSNSPNKKLPLRQQQKLVG